MVSAMAMLAAPARGSELHRVRMTKREAPEDGGAAWRARAKKEEEKANASSGAEERGEAFDARVFALADAESALSVIKRSLDGCKTATEWSKSEIAKISSGRDV